MAMLAIMICRTIISKTSNSFNLGSRWAKEKKENHLNAISKMIGTLVQVQLYAFSSRTTIIIIKNFGHARKTSFFTSKKEDQITRI